MNRKTERRLSIVPQAVEWVVLVTFDVFASFVIRAVLGDLGARNSLATYKDAATSAAHHEIPACRGQMRPVS